MDYEEISSTLHEIRHLRHNPQDSAEQQIVNALALILYELREIRESLKGPRWPMKTKNE